MKKLSIDEINNHLKMGADSYLEDKNILIDNIKNDTSRLYSLNVDVCSYGMYQFFVKKNIEEAKQYFYLSGKLTVYDILLNNEKLHRPIEEKIAFLLISDNKKLIEQFSKVRQSTYDSDIKEFLTINPSVQAILRDDWEHLKELIGYLKYNVENTRGWKQYQADLMFFESFLEDDSKKMKEAILLLATKYHKRRYDMLLYRELIAIPALGYAKLAYIKGYELDIDNPLIPKELLPIKPNKEYWDFDFMKEGVFKDV